VNPRVLALSGGVGGAKLVLGLDRIHAAGELSVIVNTADDFTHLGLRICPDLDTTFYTLSGDANPEVGWGRRDESWAFMLALEQLGGETWFRLGDRDLALHAYRTSRLAQGERLTTIMIDVAARRGLATMPLPMTDDPVRTAVITASGPLAFQHYFVREQCQPAVVSLRYDGAAAARVSPEVAAAFASPRLEAIVICPSNPYLSIDPLLAVPDLRSLLAKATVPVIAVTPLVGGRAIKGPTTKIMTELGIPCSARAIAAHYGELIDGFVLDREDEGLAPSLGMPSCVTNTVMRTLEDRIGLARAVVEFAGRLRGSGQRP